MSQFEFVLTGTSFLIAIMISRVILTLSEVKLREADFRHVSWLVVLTFHMMIYWWFGWRFREIEYTARLYFVQMLPTLVLLFTATVLTPRDVPNDWSSFFNDNRQRFFAWYCCFWVLLAVAHYFLLDQISPSVLPFALCLVGLLIKAPAVQKFLPVIMGIAFLVIGLANPEKL